MKLDDIIKTLFLRLPQCTNLFTDQLAPASVNYDNNTSVLEISTTVDHELASTDLVTLSGVIEPLTINSLTYDSVNCTATAVSDTPVDIVVSCSASAFNNGVRQNAFDPEIRADDSLVTIAGADQVEYNGTFPVVEVIDAFTFVYLIIGAQPIADPATGAIQLLKEVNPFNSLFAVTVIDGDTFSVEIAPSERNVPIPPNAPLLPFTIHKNHRISGALNIERVLVSYTKQPNKKFWVFAVREGDTGDGSVASFDNEVDNDAVHQAYQDAYFKQTIIEHLGLYVFAPTVLELGGIQTRDLMEDVKKFLFSSILGVVLPSNFVRSSYSSLSFVNDGFFSYTSAYYVHKFNFQRTILIQAGDLAQELNYTYLDCLNINYLNENTIKQEIIMTDVIRPED